MPVGSLVVRSLRVGDGVGLGHYRALTDPDATRALRVSVTEAMGNSLRTAVDATVLAMALGLIVAVLVSRRPRSHGWSRVVSGLDGAFMLPLGISAVTVGFGFLITSRRRSTRSRTGVLHTSPPSTSATCASTSTTSGSPSRGSPRRRA